jgi:hypothetical protein
MSKRDSLDDLDDDVDKEILTGMNLAALEYDLKLCREHGTYVPIETLAFAIHHSLKDDTEMLIKHLCLHERQARARVKEGGRRGLVRDLRRFPLGKFVGRAHPSQTSGAAGHPIPNGKITGVDKDLAGCRINVWQSLPPH